MAPQKKTPDPTERHKDTKALPKKKEVSPKIAALKIEKFFFWLTTAKHQYTNFDWTPEKFLDISGQFGSLNIF
jgi:hypothetical protein